MLFSDSSGVPDPKGPGDPVWGGAYRNAEVKRRFPRPGSGKMIAESCGSLFV